MNKILFFLGLFLLSVSASVDLSGFNLIPLNTNIKKTIVTVSKGEKFVLKIASNPTTGYNWNLANSYQLKSSNVLTFLSESESGEYESAAYGERIVGAGGNSFFKFQGTNCGSSTVELEYKRSWETEAVNQLKVEVQVVA